MVEKIMSVISITPTLFSSPTRTTTWGLLTSWKLLPDPAMTDHTSPTILEPAGKVRVDVTTYVPASKKTILDRAYYSSLSSNDISFDTTHLVENGLESTGIVRSPISFCATLFYTDKIINRMFFILRARLSKNFPRTVEQY